jgi:hypothetical protein
MKNYTYPKSFFLKKNQHFLNPFLAKIKLKPQYNNAENAIEISERKMILRLFDVLLFYSFFMRLDIFRFRLSEAALTKMKDELGQLSCHGMVP